MGRHAPRQRAVGSRAHVHRVIHLLRLRLLPGRRLLLGQHSRGNETAENGCGSQHERGSSKTASVRRTAHTGCISGLTDHHAFVPLGAIGRRAGWQPMPTPDAIPSGDVAPSPAGAGLDRVRAAPEIARALRGPSGRTNKQQESAVIRPRSLCRRLPRNNRSYFVPPAAETRGHRGRGGNSERAGSVVAVDGAGLLLVRAVACHRMQESTARKSTCDDRARPSIADLL